MGGTRGRRSARGGRPRGRAHEQHLRATAGRPNPAALHREGPEGKSCGVEGLPGAVAHRPARLRRLDSYGQAAGNARQAHSRVDLPAGCWKEAGLEITRSRAESNACRAERNGVSGRVESESRHTCHSPCVPFRRYICLMNKERDMEQLRGHLPPNTPSIVSAQEWEAARQQLLAKEKAVTRSRDALAAERRRMPWLAVEKAYAFDGPGGKASLLDLFDGRRQLIVYRAFFEPGVYGWPEHACRGCSFVADQVAHLAHLNARDTTLAFVSRAPQADIERLKERMDWKMPWYTITDSFDADFGVDEWHGTNVFIRGDDGKVFRTYFINNRGDEQMGSTWNYLDITPLGRQEAWEDSPEGYPQDPPYKWWNWHDSYSESPSSRWSSVIDRSLVLLGETKDDEAK